MKAILNKESTLNSATKIFDKLEKLRSLIIAKSSLEEESLHFNEFMHLSSLELDLISDIHKDINKITMDIFKADTLEETGA